MNELKGWLQATGRFVRRHGMVFLVAILVGLLLGLVATVLLRGDSTAQLGLASELAAGLVVAVVVVWWEQREQVRARREAARTRGAILRTLTEYVGAELSPLGAQLQLVGVDDQGGEIELFPSIDEAVNAFRSHRGVHKMMREVGRRRGRMELQGDLLRTLRRIVPRFYGRLERHIEVFLDYFMTSGDDRSVGALLELWDHRDNIPDSPVDTTPSVSEVLAMTQGIDIPFLRHQREYLRGVVLLLLWYSELLRAVDGVQSGIPGRRERTPPS